MKKVKWGRALLGTVAVAICMTSAVGAAGQAWFSARVDTLDVSSELATPASQMPRPEPSATGSTALPTPSASPSPTGPTLPTIDPASLTAVNVLVIGSDTREGQGNQYGDVSGARSDTTMLVHINAGWDKASVVSIPRDLMVTIPECDGRAPHETRFNAAFSEGGVKCTIRAVKSLTGLDINHVVVVDFKGMKDIVNAMGGLDVCIAYPMKDEKSGLDLKAGRQTLTGKQVLALSRARYNLGNGSDIDRIGRQQQVVSALIRQISDSGTLSNPVTLYSLADAGLSAVSVDDGLDDTSEVVAFLTPLAGMSEKDIEFVTWPWTWSPGMATVDTDWEKADVLTAKLTADEWPLKKRKAPNPTASPSGSAESDLCANPIG